MANLSVLGVVLAIVLIAVALGIYAFTLGKDKKELRMVALVAGVIGVLMLALTSGCYNFSCSTG